MSFLFASSHLPAVRSTRPELEDEEENVNPESLPRSGGVRASSHLPQAAPAPESARTVGDRANPSPRSSSDWMARLKQQMDQEQRGRAGSGAADEDSRRADSEHEPDAEPDHDADDAHDEAPEHEEDTVQEEDAGHGQAEDTSPWYRPRDATAAHVPEGGADDPDPGFHIRQEGIGHASAGAVFYQPPVEGGERGPRDAWGDEALPSSQGWGAGRSDEGRGWSRGRQRGVVSDMAAGSTTSSTLVMSTGPLRETRSSPDAFFRQQQQIRGTSGPTAHQRLQESLRAIEALKQRVRVSSPPANGSTPAAQSLAASPCKQHEVCATSSNHTSEGGEARGLRSQRPGRSTDPGQQYSIELDKIEDEMRKLLLERRAAYDKVKNGNMPLSTDEVTRLMEVDYQRGLRANGDSEGMTFEDLIKHADDEYLYRTEPDEGRHPGHEGFRGSGFALVESPEPQFDNPHIKHLARGNSDPYFSWEINYNVVGQWLRIAGYSKSEAGLFLKAWIAKSPSKWGSNLDRQTWFWAGYDYADARQKGWHPARNAPPAKPANDQRKSPPPLP